MQRHGPETNVLDENPSYNAGGTEFPVKYVLQLKTFERPTNDQVDRVTETSGVQIVDRSGYSLFAEIAPEIVESVREQLPMWSISPQSP